MKKKRKPSKVSVYKAKGPKGSVTRVRKSKKKY